MSEWFRSSAWACRVGMACLSCIFAVGSWGCASRSPGISVSGAVAPVGKCRYLVIGFGIVEVPMTERPAAEVTRVSTVGLRISNDPGLKVGLGVATSQTVRVPAEADDVRLVVSRGPGGETRTRVDSARLQSFPHHETKPEENP